MFNEALYIKNNNEAKNFVYSYDTFDSMDDIESNSAYSQEENPNEYPYGHFVDLENMEPFETVEYYVVKNAYGNAYNVCKKTVRNPNNIKIVSEKMDNKKKRNSTKGNIFRCLCKYMYNNIHMIVMGIFATVIICNTGEKQVHIDEIR